MAPWPSETAPFDSSPVIPASRVHNANEPVCPIVTNLSPCNTQLGSYLSAVRRNSSSMHVRGPAGVAGLGLGLSSG